MDARQRPWAKARASPTRRTTCCSGASDGLVVVRDPRTTTRSSPPMRGREVADGDVRPRGAPVSAGGRCEIARLFGRHGRLDGNGGPETATTTARSYVNWQIRLEMKL